MLTAQRLREALDFDPSRGVFVWKTPTSRRVRAGFVATGRSIRIDGARYSLNHLRQLWDSGRMPGEGGTVAQAPIPSLPGEMWRPVRGFEGAYVVSSLGRVASLARVIAQSNGSVRVYRTKIQKARVNAQTGYPSVCLQIAARGVSVWSSVHSLVAEAFLPPRPDGAQVRHKDGSRDNCAATNLEWGQHIDNMHDQYRHGTRIAGEWHPLAVLTTEIVEWIRESSQPGAAIARALGVSTSTVCRARKAKTYAALRRADLVGLVPR